MNLLASIHAPIVAAIIAGVVSLIVTLMTLVFTPASRWITEFHLNRQKASYEQSLEMLRHEHQLEVEREKQLAEYEMEQRKALRAKVGEFRGRLIEVGNALNYRLDNMREHSQATVGDESIEKWLDRGGQYVRNGTDGYYFVSTIYRFMAFVGVANRFERSSIFIDRRFGEDTDLQVAFYVRALRWVLTEPKLFADLEPPYEHQDAPDHFFTDDLRQMCGELMDSEGALRELHEIPLQGNAALAPVLAFFDGLSAGSLKWDRLMAFALLLKAFLNTIGYEQMKSSQEWFDDTAAAISRRQVRQNLLAWLPRLALDDGPELTHVRQAIERAERGVGEAPPASAADGAEPLA